MCRLEPFLIVWPALEISPVLGLWAILSGLSYTETVLEAIGVLESEVAGLLIVQILISEAGVHCMLYGTVQTVRFSKELRLMAISYQVQLITTLLIISFAWRGSCSRRLIL